MARLVLFLVPALAFVALLGAVLVKRTVVPVPGDQAPAFEASLLDGDGTLALASLRGRPVVLNFWASWCGPCRDEAPMLRRAHAAYKDDVAFVGVDIKDAATDAAAFAQKYGLEYPHVRDEQGVIYDAYGLTGQPESFFVDASGEIVEHVNGPLTEPALGELLDLLVARDA